MKTVHAYVDSMYDKNTKLCTFSYVILDESEVAVLHRGKYVERHPGYCNMKKVGGEIRSCEEVIKWALMKGVNVKIYHSFKDPQIEKLPTGKLYPTNVYENNYQKLVNAARLEIYIDFKKINKKDNTDYRILM